MLIFVGAPGSGKSTFYREYLSSSHIRLNNDTIKNPKKALLRTTENLLAGKNVVIDNLNASLGIRQTYIDLAKEAGIKTVRCIYFQTDKETCLVNNDLRKLADSTKGYLHMSGNVSKIVIHTYFKNHVPPTTKEGFT